MQNKRLLLSFIALIGSVFLFVFSSFAWFAFSQNVDCNETQIDVVNIDCNYLLEVSYDAGVNYQETTQLLVSNAVPGDMFYYRLTIQNTGNIPISSQVLMIGFENQLSNPTGSQDNYLAGETLLDVIKLTVSNNLTLDQIDNSVLSDLLITNPQNDLSLSSIQICDSVPLNPDETVTIHFTFYIDPLLAGNDFQNLNLHIDTLSIQSQN